MPKGLNRTLQVRTADRLRAGLALDERSGLPLMGGLSEAEQRELCEVGGGRLAAIAIRIESWAAPEPLPAEASRNEALRAKALPAEALPIVAVREAARLIAQNVRRTDVFGALRPNTLLVLAAGLDSVGGRNLAERLLELLDQRRIESSGSTIELRVRVGVAFRATAAPTSWAGRALVTEAERDASDPLAAVS